MNNAKFLSLTAFIIINVINSSCNKEYQNDKEVIENRVTIENPSTLMQTNIDAEGIMEFAPQTPNPYSVTNMQLAKQMLIDESEFECDYDLFHIRPTHRYIKFMPEDSIQEDFLNDDTTLILFDYPLDRRLIKSGTYYRDPILPENVPNYQWCCVTINQVLPPGIPYDEISELYLPESDETLIEYYNTSFDGCINLLIDKAMKITGNFDTLQSQTNLKHGDQRGIKISLRPPPKWAPKGTIRIFDDRLNQTISLEGVKVRANRWFETRESLTNANGYYDIGHEFRYPVDYSIKWERADYHIKSGGFGQAYYNGPHQKGDWNLDISRSSSGASSWLFGHVHRAALRYFYKDIGGLRRPGQRDFRYWVFDRAGGWHNHSGSQGINYSELARINGKETEGGSYYSSDEIFSTTIHETAHSTHLKIMNSGYLQFSQVSRIIQESYPIGVEWLITKIEYKALGITNYSDPNYEVVTGYPNQYGYQYWNTNSSADYTSLFIDIIDNFNQNNKVFATRPNGSVNDHVSGFQLSNIEGWMQNIYGLTTLKNKLKSNKPSGITDAQIDTLFQSF